MQWSVPTLSVKDGISDNKVKFGKISTLQPIMLCYMDIPIHLRFKNNKKMIKEIFPNKHPKIELFA